MPGLINRLRRSSLARGIVIVGALTLAARGMAVVRELVVAGTYGVGEDLDAVFTALVIPISLIGILTSTVQSSLIPELVAARSRAGTMWRLCATGRSAHPTSSDSIIRMLGVGANS